jgi:hypothetical protein
MTTRLRKTFNYPTKDSYTGNSDEQEQETLIQTLTNRDNKNTYFYRRAFALLPATAALAYLPTLLFPSSLRNVLLAVLSLSSLAITAYILLGGVVAAPEKMVDGGSGRLSASMIDARGPLDVALPWLNAGLCAVLALNGLLASTRGLLDDAWLAALPLLVFIITLYARSQMQPLDVASLERLKYNYKGA